jgi:hypothetical protein
MQKVWHPRRYGRGFGKLKATIYLFKRICMMQIQPENKGRVYALDIQPGRQLAG